jgi:outer membrane scaffolding protein for murein synthesis (MipA/OmpV family)
MSKLNVAALTLVFACQGAHAQTPAPNPMPDGSGDLYAGLGVVSTPRYAGAAARRTRLLPVLQGQWSNGVFVSGLSAGLHLSHQSWLEFGPLLALDPGRDAGGEGASAVGIEANRPKTVAGFASTPNEASASVSKANRLDGLPSIARRVQGGAFLNLFVAPNVRLTSNVLYGAGNAHNGATLAVGAQVMALAPAPHHTVTFDGGLVLANRQYNQAFFGIDSEQSVHSGSPLYAAHGGWRDFHVGANWHWTLAPSWLLVSRLDATRQLGSTRDSPLVARPAGVSVSTALAFRF